MHAINVFARSSAHGPVARAEQIGARVFELDEGQLSHPFHFHHGIEQWLLALAGAPLLRTPDGERGLRQGDLVSFPAGPAGAHQVSGCGTILILSEQRDLDLVEYPDSGLLELRPSGRTFRGSEAVAPLTDHAPRTVNLYELALVTDPSQPPGFVKRIGEFGPKLDAERLGGTVYELDPAEATAPYHFEGVEEEWVLVLSGAPTLRDPDGEHDLATGDLVCFPQGPEGAHKLTNRTDEVTRVAMFSTQPPKQLSVCVYPDSEKVGVWPWPAKRLRITDSIDYWDGEL